MALKTDLPDAAQGRCLDEATVLSFVAGTLGGDARAGVEAHLDACPSCTELITWVAADAANRSKAPGQEGRPFVGRIAPGTSVGRYQVLGAIGRGGMGEVYAAYHPDLDRRIALKVVVAAGTNTEERRARLVREARTLARLSHPHVVQVYDAGAIEDGVYIAMEFVEGETLAEWLRTAPRTWQVVLEVFEAAGRGLAAAHAAQIVHRDFKPQNVMIGRDGAVRVTDFGLARSADEVSAPIDASINLEAPAPSTITETGAVVGTPAYMAPEQFRGEVPDARADQFSFCVALHEALYGVRPALPHLGGPAHAVRRGGVPAWLRAIVDRGLARDRDDRFRSMDDLLAAAARGRTRLRRRATAAGVVALAGLMTLVAWRALRAGRVACAVPQDRIAAAWSAPDRRAAVKRAFEAAGRTGWPHLAATLDDYVNQWGAMYVAACEATHVRGEQSAEVLDLRMACLRDNLDHVGALTDALTTAGSDAVVKAGVAAQNLPPNTRCADIALLKSALPPPKDEPTRRAIERLRRQIAEVDALLDIEATYAALAKARALQAEVEATGYPPLLADLLEKIGVAVASTTPTEAEPILKQALYIGEASRNDLAVARAAMTLAFVVGARLGRGADGELWVKLSQAVLERLGPGEESRRLRAQLDNTQGACAAAEGDYAASERFLRQSLSIKQTIWPSQHPEIGLVRSNLGFALLGQERYAEALEEETQAVEIFSHGGDPALRAEALANRADVLVALGRLSDARRDIEQALPLVPPGDVSEADALTSLGRLLLAEGNPAAAVSPLEKAIAVHQKNGPDSSLMADAKFTLARAIHDGGSDLSRAEELGREALALYRQHKHVNRARDVDAWLAKLHPSVRLRQPPATPTNLRSSSTR